jgi:peptidyl-tRNA hydrolase
MPLFMDVHTIAGGVALDDVAHAHQADLETQGRHDVRYLQYWVNEGQGKVFCLVDAPTPDAAAAVHREAHGLVADEIYPVREGD